jgi:hypothetical protein
VLHLHARAGRGNIGKAQVGGAYILEVDADGGCNRGRLLFN